MDGVGMLTTFLTAEQIRFQISYPIRPGQYQITVTTPGLETSNAVVLTISACEFSATSTSLIGPAGGGTVPLTITSTGCSYRVRPLVDWVTVDAAAVNFFPNSGASRTGSIIVQGTRNDDPILTITVNQPGCGYALSATNASVPAGGGSGNFRILADSTCSWRIETPAPGVTVTSPRTGMGNSDVTFTVSSNIGPERNIPISISSVASNLVFTINQPSGCTYSLSADTNIPSSGMTNRFMGIIPSAANCPWTATSDSSWLIITSPSTGTGMYNLLISAAPNTGVARTGRITVNGQTITFTQASGINCTYSISPTSASIGANGGLLNVAVTAPQGCTWSASNTNSWAIISAGNTGTGNGSILVAVEPNSGTTSRSSTLTIAGQTYTVNQAAPTNCTYLIPPALTVFPSNGGGGIFDVITQPGCAWTATTSTSWITLNNSSGSGSGAVSFNVAANTTFADRTGTIIFGAQTYTVTQTRNCAYSIAPETGSFLPNGGRGSITVTTQSGCQWTAVPNQPWVTVTSGGSGTGNGTVSYTVAAENITVLRSANIIIGDKTFVVYQSPELPPQPPSTLYDFDGDRKADISIYRDGTWWFGASSANGSHRAIQFGALTDRLVPADYDGDDKTDPAVFRDGYWHVLKSSTNSYAGIQFGFADDIAVPGDYDGDGRADFAVYRPSNGYWYIFTAYGNFLSRQWGESTDKPVAADFDGDRKTDIAVFRPSNGTWYVLQSYDQTLKAIQWGESTDVPVVGDYDGDNKADAAVWRPSNGTWYVMRSRDGFAAQQFGQIGDALIPADYDGDGKTDVEVVRGGTWYQLNSITGVKMTVFGYATDKPVPNSFVR